jgi:hypothetical protein
VLIDTDDIMGTLNTVSIFYSYLFDFLALLKVFSHVHLLTRTVCIHNIGVAAYNEHSCM